MRILLIDHSVVSYKSFYRIFSQEYSGETNDESYEFTRSYCGLIQYYVELFKTDAALWLLDCPRADVWRHDVVQEYYIPRTEVWANVFDDELDDPNLASTFMGIADGIYRKVWTGPDLELHGKQLYKKDFDAAAEQWDMDARKITDPEVFARVAAKIIPQYKGTREGGHWPKSAVLDKEQFVKKSLELAKAIAPHYNGKLAKGANLEADDLAYAAVLRYPQHEFFVVTTDKDWKQLALFHPNVTIFDPNEYAIMDTRRAVVIDEMWEKLLSGDKSDNVKSIRMTGKTSGISEAAARAILEQNSKAGVRMSEWVAENVEPEGLDKNRTLVNLKCAPAEILGRAKYAIENAVKPNTDKPLTYYVNETTLELAKAEAQKLAAKWELMKGTKKK